MFVKFPIIKGVLYNQSMLPENEYYSFENRNYIQPQVSLDEQNAFIDNLRNVQAQKNQQVATQTYNLGTAVPSNLGGLMGGSGYWKSRYQTPQTNSLVSDLRTTAQAKALNDILANEQAKMQKRYNAAYRSSQIRGSNGGGSGGGGGEGDKEEQETTTPVTVGPEGISQQMYMNKFNNYIKNGYDARGAEFMTKIELGLASSLPSGSRDKSALNGTDTSYIYTLPNGRTVLVDESKYSLVINGNGFALKNKETGELTTVGE